MKNNSTKTPLTTLLLLILALAFVGAAQAQSTNQSAPTPITAIEISAKGPAKEMNYYYSFTGGPGEVSVTLHIKAKQYSTFARLELLGPEFNTLATHNMNATTGSGPVQVTKKIGLSEKQTVLLKVTLDGNLAEYKIKLGGAVELGATTMQGGATPPTDAFGSASSNSEFPTSDPASTGASSAVKDKFFNVDLGKFKLGQFLNLPNTGILVLAMSDGTTHEIDLRGVKSLTIKKP